MNTLANIKTITKRELGAYFSSPLAYVFSRDFSAAERILHVFFPTALGTYFKRGDASLVTFFIWHPLFYLSCSGGGYETVGGRASRWYVGTFNDDADHAVAGDRRKVSRVVAFSSG